MFTGIIKNKGKVVSIVKKNKGYEVKINSNLVFSKKNIGTSISINGVCLTLTKFLNKNLFFFISYSTFQITNFKYLKKNSTVNLEKSLKFGDEIAGHFVQGHIDTIGKVISLKKLAKEILDQDTRHTANPFFVNNENNPRVFSFFEQDVMADENNYVKCNYQATKMNELYLWLCELGTKSEDTLN